MGDVIRRRGSLLRDDLRVLDRIHRSRYYDVFDVWDATRRCRCIVKCVRPDQRQHRRAGGRLMREGQRLRTMAHPHIVRVWEVVRAPEPMMVQETLTGETLGHLLETAVRRMTETEVAWMGMQLTSALAYLHDRGLVHLDLKPANVVAERGRAVLIDLSVARAPGVMRAGRGTWCYMAPEQARGGYVGHAADVWGLGIVMHEALTGEPAYGDTDTDRPQLRAVPPPLGGSRRVRAPLRIIVEACLDPDPANRPSLDAVMDGLAAVAGTPYPPS